MSASFRESDGGGNFTLPALLLLLAEPKGAVLLLSLLPLMFMFMKASAAFETASLIFSIALSLSISKAKSIQSPVS